MTTAPLGPSSTPTGHVRLLFVGAALVAGFLPAAVTFALDPRAADDIGLTVVPVPAWAFVLIWVVVYSGTGLAAARLWQLRTTIGCDVGVPLAVLVAGFLQSTSFWLTDSLRATAVMDATGVVLALTTLWIVGRYSGAAARSLWPWAAWMPITLLIKLCVLVGLVAR